MAEEGLRSVPGPSGFSAFNAVAPPFNASGMVTDATSSTHAVSLSSLASPAALFALFLVYAAICSSLRFRHEKAMLRRFNYPDRASLARMTSNDAQSILADLMTFEFPFIYKTALQFAIFKTYGFETMSRLIVATKSFSDPKTAPKRYEDTVVIFGQFQLNPPTSAPCIKAISRMNFLHSQYKKAGKISNADFLYTLSVCVTEPIRFINLYEWRPLNHMEINAIGCFWKSLGDAMQIEYKGYLSRDTWKDGIEFVEDITSWAKGYEVEAMKPAKTNTLPAYALADMLIYYVPSLLKPFAIGVLTALMGDRVRDAFMYPEPSIFTVLVAYGALNIRRLVMRYLMLPRFSPLRFFSDPDPKTGRVHHFDWLVQPYYVKGTFWNRWGPEGWLTWALGGVVPGSGGEKFVPQGFLFEDIGPEAKRGKGKVEMEEWERILKEQRPSGCPFSRG